MRFRLMRSTPVFQNRIGVIQKGEKLLTRLFHHAPTRLIQFYLFQSEITSKIFYQKNKKRER
jgi:hypothetical protein